MINGEVENTELDNVKTAKNVRIFLKTVFPDYLIEAGYHRTDIKVNKINQNGFVSHTNAAPDGRMKHIYTMQNKCKAVYQAIAGLPDSSKKPFKRILTGVYLEELEDWKVANKLGYCRSRYWELKQQACCQFARSLIFQKTMYDVEIPDLQVFKCESNK